MSLGNVRLRASFLRISLLLRRRVEIFLVVPSARGRTLRSLVRPTWVDFIGTLLRMVFASRWRRFARRAFILLRTLLFLGTHGDSSGGYRTSRPLAFCAATAVPLTEFYVRHTNSQFPIRAKSGVVAAPTAQISGSQEGSMSKDHNSAWRTRASWARRSRSLRDQCERVSSIRSLIFSV